MAQRTTLQLGLGDYASPIADKSESVFVARLALIDATRRYLPQFLKTLLAEVFPEYCRLIEVHPEFRGFLFTWQMFRALPARTEFEQFIGVFTKWARGFNAEEDWVFQQAWRALHGWDLFPESKTTSQWWVGHSGHSFSSERFKFEWEPWHVQIQTWMRYRADIQKAFEDAVKEFEYKARKAALAHGLKRVPRTSSAVNFKWFALYQFGGMSTGQIATRTDSHELSTIWKGVKTAQRLVGWKCLRPPSRKTR